MGISHDMRIKQIDILISKNQVLHAKCYTLNTMYMKLHKLAIMDKKLSEIHKNLIPTKLTTIPCNTKSYNSINTNIPNNWPAFLPVNNGYTSSYALIRIHFNY